MPSPKDRVGSKRRHVRLPIDITDAQLAAIDDYRLANHLPSRSEVVRQLLMTGMLSGDEQPE